MKILIYFLFAPLLSFAQGNWEKVDAQIFMDFIREYEQLIPEGDNYSLETGYKIYNNAQDQQPVQMFDGRLICKSGKMLNVFQMGHVMIQDDELNLTIDTVGKKVLIQNPDPSFFYRKTVKDYATFLETAETVQRMKIGDKDVFRLILKKGNPYEAMDFIFSERNFISQITIYSNQPYYTDGDLPSSDKAKIVLDFKNFKKGKSVDLKHFLTVKEIIVFKDKTPSAIGKFREFEVIDLRN